MFRFVFSLVPTQTPIFSLLPLRRRRRAMAPATALELRMKKASFLENVSKVLSDLFSDAYFEFSGTGLELQAVDTSGGAYAVLQLRSEAFDHYSCDHDHSMGLDLAAMVKAFSFANNNDIISIQCQIGGFSFPISLGSPDSRVFRCFLLDFEDVEGVPVSVPEHPESMYQAIVRMPSIKFKHICNQLSSFLDTGDRKTGTCNELSGFWDTGDMDTVVSISVDKDNVRFFTDKLSIILRLQAQNGDKLNEATCIEMKEKISLTFGLRYLNSFSKASAVSDQVTIKLSSNLPAVFEYKIVEMGYIRYYVKPTDKKAEMQGIEVEMQSLDLIPADNEM